MRADSVVVNLEAVKASSGAAGVPVLKHCRDAASARARPQRRRRQARLEGRPEGGDHARAQGRQRGRLTELDPRRSGAPEKRSGGMAGTETLRKSALGPEVGKQAFSLILPDRTLDVQCATPNEASAHAAPGPVAQAK
ncbi:hypothetical protein JL721_5327 [Aureococcus anophagefferens]|nr:hypothetical protein JL721_5327 [Aureococcus anophagefferens]